MVEDFSYNIEINLRRFSLVYGGPVILLPPKILRTSVSQISLIIIGVFPYIHYFEFTLFKLIRSQHQHQHSLQSLGKIGVGYWTMINTTLCNTLCDTLCNTEERHEHVGKDAGCIAV